MLGKDEARDLIGDTLYPALNAEQEKLNEIDRWARWDHDKPFTPVGATTEYRQLNERSQTPWLSLIVTAVAQQLYVEGYRGKADPENAAPWDIWQANRMDKRQIPVHRAALTYGYAYGTVLPGTNPLTGDALPVMRGVSPRRMIAFYHGIDDEWPAYALERLPRKGGWDLKLYDDEVVWTFQCGSSGDGLLYIEFEIHDSNVCPVVQFANLPDLEGRMPGEVEPNIPVASRIDQTIFDRLIVQRFASWKVRTIAGMEKPSTPEAEAAQQRLKVNDMLVSEDSDTKFGTLDETPLDGFINAAKHDIETLAAVSQTPAHEMLGQMANLSAEALAAAELSLTRKVTERQHTFGESHEQWLRLAAWVADDRDSALDTSAEIRWADTESKSLSQAADALGKLAEMLQIPVEVLWEKVPGLTQQDIDLAKTLRDQQGVNALLDTLANGLTSAENAVPN